MLFHFLKKKPEPQQPAADLAEPIEPKGPVYECVKCQYKTTMQFSYCPVCGTPRITSDSKDEAVDDDILSYIESKGDEMLTEDDFSENALPDEDSDEYEISQDDVDDALRLLDEQPVDEDF